MRVITAIAKSPLAKDAVKTFVLSSAATAGTFAGFLAIGWVWGKFDKLPEDPKETPIV